MVEFSGRGRNNFFSTLHILALEGGLSCFVLTSSIINTKWAALWNRLNAFIRVNSRQSGLSSEVNYIITIQQQFLPLQDIGTNVHASTIRTMGCNFIKFEFRFDGNERPTWWQTLIGICSSQQETAETAEPVTRMWSLMAWPTERHVNPAPRRNGHDELGSINQKWKENVSEKEKWIGPVEAPGGSELLFVIYRSYTISPFFDD